MRNDQRPLPYYLFILGAALVWFGVLGPSFAPTAGQVGVSIGSIEVNRDAAYLTPWALACDVGGIVSIGVLRARGALQPGAFAALVVSVVGFVFGAKLQYQLEELPLSTALRFLPQFFLEPGVRMPLGLLLGGLVACATAVAARTPWRAVGDAWAVGAAAAIVVGRIGCLLAGCCAGIACGPFAPAFLCWSYPPESEVFADQVTMGLISPTSPASLPVHPLPLYFSLASLVTTATLVLLLRRGAKPGTLLATFCILRPLAKLALEPLRADPRPGLLMTAIPMTVLATACIVLAVGQLHRAMTRRPPAAPRAHAA
jgi:phosphatidylglycerol:prolipoprotein diacylglycerol transferase